MRTTRTVSYIPYSFVPNHTATIEALALSRLSARELRTVLFIMRQTDGYLRNEDQIAPAFFARNTAIGKDHIPQVLARLRKLNIINVTPGKPPTYSVNPPNKWSKSAFAKNGESDSPNPARNLAKNGEIYEAPKDNLKTTIYRQHRIYNTKEIDPEKYTRGKYGRLVKR